ncbi:MAG: NusG domain II-containing protein [Mogibacterium sp.]|nr:NusG domain II-containing protein [Mogibacterium sp.]
MKKFLTKADIILLIVLVLIGIASTVYVSSSKTGGDKISITRSGKLYGTYSLIEDREIPITDDSGEVTNTVVINGGKVHMGSASCHNQVCVHHAAISSNGESIICLPNRVIVQIEGGGGYDAISR